MGQENRGNSSFKSISQKAAQHDLNTVKKVIFAGKHVDVSATKF